jgi:DnaJ-domain-containing protein 1
MKQEQLDARAAVDALTQKTSGDHARFVQYEHIAGIQQFRKVAKVMVSRVLAIEDH